MSLSFSCLPYAIPVMALVDTTICVRGPESAYFPCWKRLLLLRKSASLPVGQNKMFFHQRSMFPSRWAHWCFQKLFSFMSNVPSQLLVFLCSRCSACFGLTLWVGSRCWLHDRSVSAMCFDKSRLFPAGFWRVFLCFPLLLLWALLHQAQSMHSQRMCPVLFLMFISASFMFWGFLKCCPSHGWESLKFCFSFTNWFPWKKSLHFFSLARAWRDAVPA